MKLETSDTGFEGHGAEAGALGTVAVAVVALRPRLRLADRLDFVDVLERVALVARPGESFHLLRLLVRLLRGRRVPGFRGQSLKKNIILRIGQ